MFQTTVHAWLGCIILQGRYAELDNRGDGGGGGGGGGGGFGGGGGGGGGGGSSGVISYGSCQVRGARRPSFFLRVTSPWTQDDDRQSSLPPAKTRPPSARVVHFTRVRPPRQKKKRLRASVVARLSAERGTNSSS